jgi:hypothetical protein
MAALSPPAALVGYHLRTSVCRFEAVALLWIVE